MENPPTRYNMCLNWKTHTPAKWTRNTTSHIICFTNKGQMGRQLQCAAPLPCPIRYFVMNYAFRGNFWLFSHRSTVSCCVLRCSYASILTLRPIFDSLLSGRIMWCVIHFRVNMRDTSNTFLVENSLTRYNMYSNWSSSTLRLREVSKDLKTNKSHTNQFAPLLQKLV